MKKFISVLLVLLMITSFFTMQSAAEDEANFVVSTASAKAGETVSVAFSLENNPGIVAMQIKVSYDPAVLRLDETSNTGLFGSGDMMFGNDYTKIPFTVFWEDSLSRVNHTENGAFAVLTFTVLEDAPEGESAVTMEYVQGSTFDVDMDDVEFGVKNGSVTVLPAVEDDWSFSEECTLQTMKGTFGKDFIVGFDEYDIYLDGLVNVTGNYTYEIVPNAQETESTGAQLLVKDGDGNVVETYYSVVYGDLNGDSMVDPSDVAILLASVIYDPTVWWAMWEAPDEFPESLAADLNHDGMVDTIDLAIFLSAITGSYRINQNWTCEDDEIVIYY